MNIITSILKNKAKMNSILLCLFVFIVPLNLPIKIFLKNDYFPIIMLIFIVSMSFLINKGLNVKFVLINIAIASILLANLLIGDYKVIVINRMIEFIRWGLIPLYLTSRINDYNDGWRFWYVISTINLIGLNICLPYENEFNYMHMGVSLLYSFIVIAFAYYNSKKYRIVNIVLLVVIFLEILVFGNRGSLLACILMVMYMEMRKLYTKNIMYTIPKMILIIIVSIILYSNIGTILTKSNDFIKSIGIESYAIEKLIIGIDNGINVSSSGRDDIKEASLDIIKESPLIPKGIGYFESVTGYVYPHNLFLEIIITFGGIGFIIFISIIITLFLKYITKMRKIKYINDIIVLLFIFISTRLLLSSTFWEENIFWIIIGLITFYRENSNKCVTC